MYTAQSSRPSTSGGQHNFTTIPRAEIQRSQFDRSCGIKTSFDAGLSIPIYLDEALPGDTISLNMSVFARMGTPLFPVMDNQWLDYHFFAVPIRLLWSNWEKFNGAQDDPGDSTVFIIPKMVTDAGTGVLEGSLGDYFGLPLGIKSLTHSALFHRAHNKIYNDWYRDENLQDSVPNNLGDGPDALVDYNIMRRGKRKDYFTACLPFPQKGPAVELPLGTSAPVVSQGTGIPLFAPSAGAGGGTDGLDTFGTADLGFENPSDTDGPLKWVDTALETDLTSATAATINQLRQAFQIQKLYERDARGGTRYTEILLSHFGVTSPDQRLQRAEFLGGGSTVISVLPVAGTNPAGTGILGELGGFVTTAGSGIGFTKSFTEHCMIIGYVTSRADINYQQGLNRMFSRSTRWDFFWPALAHLGEQSVLNKEIYAQGSDDPTADDAVFGYQERFAEYRYKPSQITGPMRSTSATPLDQWHLAQEFSALPVLDATFIEENPPMNRVLAITAAAFTDFLFDAYFQINHARPMPTYSVPGMIDHF